MGIVVGVLVAIEGDVGEVISGGMKADRGRGVLVARKASGPFPACPCFIKKPPPINRPIKIKPVITHRQTGKVERPFPSLPRTLDFIVCGISLASFSVISLVTC